MKNTIKFILGLGLALTIFALSPAADNSASTDVSVEIPTAEAFVFAKFPVAVYCPKTQNFKTDCDGSGEGCEAKECQKPKPPQLI